MLPPAQHPRDASVYIVDDDAAVRDSLSLLLGVKGFRTASFAFAESFLASHRPGEAGCLLLDVRMPGMSGLDLQAELASRGDRLPVIIITGHGDVAMARAALRAGAEDFLEKPIDEDALLQAMGTALDRASQRRRQAAEGRRLRRAPARAHAAGAPGDGPGRGGALEPGNRRSEVCWRLSR